MPKTLKPKKLVRAQKAKEVVLPPEEIVLAPPSIIPVEMPYIPYIAPVKKTWWQSVFG